MPNLTCDCGHKFTTDQYLYQEINAHFSKGHDYEPLSIKCDAEYQTTKGKKSK